MTRNVAERRSLQSGKIYIESVCHLSVWKSRILRVRDAWEYRRLIPKSAFMQFLAILTFLHIWKNKSRGNLKMQGRGNFCKIKGAIAPLKVELKGKMQWPSELQVPSLTLYALLSES